MIIYPANLFYNKTILPRLELNTIGAKQKRCNPSFLREMAAHLLHEIQRFYLALTHNSYLRHCPSLSCILYFNIKLLIIFGISLSYIIVIPHMCLVQLSTIFCRENTKFELLFIVLHQLYYFKFNFKMHYTQNEFVYDSNINVIPASPDGLLDGIEKLSQGKLDKYYE